MTITNDTEREFYNVKDICEIMNIGEHSARALFKQKNFPSQIIGKSYRISKKAFDDWQMSHHDYD